MFGWVSENNGLSRLASHCVVYTDGEMCKNSHINPVYTQLLDKKYSVLTHMDTKLYCAFWTSVKDISLTAEDMADKDSEM